jgi:glycosyltransferase involved in cell wall biosynthesis
MKRILILANGRLDSYKAYTQNFLSLAKYAKFRGFRVSLSGLKKSDISFLNDFADKEIIKQKSMWGIILLHIRNIYELLSKKYDIVIFGSLYTYMFPFYYLILKINRDKKIIYYMQDPVPETYLLMNVENNQSKINTFIYKIAIICEKSICTIANVILLPGNGYLNTIIRRNNLEDKTILFAYNTWGIQKHFNSSLSNDFLIEVKDRFNINKRSPVILYSGKIQRGIRGLEMQLRALKKIVKIYSDSIFIITGSGETKLIKNYIEKLDIKENVILTGNLNDIDLKAIYQISDIMIFPTVDYLLPTKFFESLLMNVIPIVWCNSDDMVKILGDMAITYNGTDESLSDTLIYVIKNIDRYKKELSQLSSSFKKYHKTSIESFNQVLTINGDYK